MPEIVGSHSVIKFQRAGSDDQITERHCYPSGRLLPTNARDNLGSGSGDWMDRHMLFQIVQKTAPVFCLRFVGGVIDAMTQFGDGQSADDDRDIAASLPQEPDYFGCGQIPALGRNQNAGIDDQSFCYAHAGGSHG